MEEFGVFVIRNLQGTSQGLEDDLHPFSVLSHKFPQQGDP